ncbi:hypothetical protein GCM10023342_29060 [Modicisalibacter zincidurans]|uniref:Uncharacterized protein n=1 Tax=Modicisalibacter zincidurans TaxID=1178777 RepID=A0ABP9RIP0_9GAMM
MDGPYVPSMRYHLRQHFRALIRNSDIASTQLHEGFEEPTAMVDLDIVVRVHDGQESRAKRKNQQPRQQVDMDDVGSAHANGIDGRKHAPDGIALCSCRQEEKPDPTIFQRLQKIRFELGTSANLFRIRDKSDTELMPVRVGMHA